MIQENAKPATPVQHFVHRCMNCGLPLVPNHHPDAGKPEHINTVGCPSGCLPCTEKRANGRHKVIVGLRMWLEDELQKYPDDRKRRYFLDEVLAKLNQLEESRRVAYHASRDTGKTVEAYEAMGRGSD